MREPARRRNALRRLQPSVERARHFSGWDFSAVHTRALEPLPWDYEALAREQARGAARLLDLGTGGGELLARILEGLPVQVVATEAWEPNVPVAGRRLAPLRVELIACHSLLLPLAGESFDLVLDRHEELAPAEVARVLRPGGRLLTQQVGSTNWRELQRHFPRLPGYAELRDATARRFAAAGLEIETDRETDCRSAYAVGLAAAGLLIERNEAHDRRVAYATLGDVVYLFSVAPWTLPDFDLERDLDALLALEADCRTPDGLVLTESRSLLIASKPPL